jgi:hypothetical protein
MVQGEDIVNMLGDVLLVIGGGLQRATWEGSPRWA